MLHFLAPACSVRPTDPIIVLFEIAAMSQTRFDDFLPIAGDSSLGRLLQPLLSNADCNSQQRRPPKS
jgi:hypothetical protein